MDSSNEIAHDFAPLLRVYKDGRIERLLGTDVVPPSVDPQTGVSSKDLEILPELGVSARLYLPKLADPKRKLPILVNYHGGGFSIETPFSPIYHSYLNSLVSQANIVAVSVHYRRAPEHLLPAAHDDSWAALQWVASHASGGAESWLRDHGNFAKLFVAGDSAGGNIAQHLAMRASNSELGHGVKIYGAILIHPFFWGLTPVESEMKNPGSKERIDRLWAYIYPSNLGLDKDPLINPMAVGAPSLSGLGCKRVLVCVAEKDSLRDRGQLFYHTLASSGWEGTVEILDSEGQDHVFYLFHPGCEEAVSMMKRLVDFLNG